MPRHSNPTLLAIEELRQSLHAEASTVEANRWWTLVMLIDAELSYDVNTTKVEHQTMRRLREAVTGLYNARNRGYAPNFSAALIAMMSLQHSLEARTTGVDGHRLR